MKNTIPLFLVLMVACRVQVGDKEKTDNFKPSYKEIISSKPDTINFVEYFDSTTNIYSNFKYGFSIKLPFDWDIDRGLSEHTVIRAHHEKNAAAFFVNVIEPDINDSFSFSLWKYLDKNRDELEFQYKNSMRELLNTSIYNYSVKKVYIDNHESLHSAFCYTLRHLNTEIQMLGTMFQISNLPYLFTAGFHVPLIVYNVNPSEFDSLINGFHFNYRKPN